MLKHLELFSLVQLVVLIAGALQHQGLLFADIIGLNSVAFAIAIFNVVCHCFIISSVLILKFAGHPQEFEKAANPDTHGLLNIAVTGALFMGCGFFKLAVILYASYCVLFLFRGSDAKA